LQLSLLFRFELFIYHAPLRSPAQEVLMKRSSPIPVERIEKAIYLIRGEKVMLDRDLAMLYGVSKKVLNQAVQRHVERFPPDFMFQLTMDEARTRWLEITANRLRSQSVTLKRGQHIKYRPHACTEHGILMLSHFD
jgi:ORF6N domain